MSDKALAFLIDFDGPICSIFDGYSAAAAAKELAALVSPRVPDIPSIDPLAILRAAPPDLAELIDKQLTTIELRAVETARSNPEFYELTNAIGHRPWAVVSNNSRSAIRTYLQRVHPDHVKVPILGRPAGRPDLMKPNPHLLLEALKVLSVPAEAAQFIGDSVTDIAAGRRAGVRTIGYANKPGKAKLLAEAGADDMAIQGQPWWLAL
ncbi:MAG: HAD family hydrolase [Actinomycetia bacterium]|nr:HAD family hydrolase [Actinomycetes bacterium]MCH9762107.1 HAD family hydrolase [Actinomycetes bacterium]